MLSELQIRKIKKNRRSLSAAVRNDADLGPLQNLPGTWHNLPTLPGRGWNMIALPFATAPQCGINYRLLMNQYNEELIFNTVDKGVRNRGIRHHTTTEDADQLQVALHYEQTTMQIAADDNPKSDETGPAGHIAHHEAGLWLHIGNENQDGLDIARLATIPHGNTVLALGTATEYAGAPNIPILNGLPIGIPADADDTCLKPYRYYHENLFRGLFDPLSPNAVLNNANKDVVIAKTTQLDVDTTANGGGIVNIPFLASQARVSEVKSTFWIQELAQTDQRGESRFRLQYSQVVLLDFVIHLNGSPELVRWPHISINTLERTSEPGG